MTADALDGLKTLDREALLQSMAAELPEIRKQLSVTQEALAEKTGVDVAKNGGNRKRRKLKCDEFASILFCDLE